MGLLRAIWNSSRALGVLALIAAIAFVMSACQLDGRESLIGSVLNVRNGCRLFWPAIDTYLVHDGTGFIDVESTDSRLGRADVIAVKAYMIEPRWRQLGLWAPTRESRTFRLYIEPMGACTSAQAAAARAEIAFRIDRTRYALTYADAAALATADLHQTRTIWSGYAYNLMSLALAVASYMAFSRRRTVRIKTAKCASQAPSDACARCGYSREGLFSDVPCPECGEFGPNQRVRDLDRPID